MIHEYQSVTLLGIDDTVQRFKLRNLKRKILVWSFYGPVITFAIWFVTSLILDYFSHIGAEDTGLFP
jgi:nitrate/nitrite transporter NarK